MLVMHCYTVDGLSCTARCKYSVDNIDRVKSQRFFMSALLIFSLKDADDTCGGCTVMV